MERENLKPWLRGRRIIKVAPHRPGDQAALHRALCVCGVRLEGRVLGVPGESVTSSANEGYCRRAPEVSPGWIQMGRVLGGPSGPVVLIARQANDANFQRVRRCRFEAAERRALTSVRCTTITDTLLNQLGTQRIPVLWRRVWVTPPRHQLVKEPRGLSEVFNFLSDEKVAPRLGDHPVVARWLSTGQRLSMDDQELCEELSRPWLEGSAIGELEKVAWWLRQLSGPEQARITLKAANGEEQGAVHLVSGGLDTLTGREAREVVAFVHKWLEGEGKNLYTLWYAVKRL